MEVRRVNKTLFLLVVNLNFYIVGAIGFFEFFIDNSFYECHNFKNRHVKEMLKTYCENHPDEIPTLFT